MLNRFLNIFKSKSQIQIIYSELVKAGGLKKAINAEFEKLHSVLRVVEDEQLDKLPFTFALIENEQKFSQVHIAAEQKLYLPDFWRDGVCLANGSTDNLSKLAAAIDYWLTQNVSTKEFAEKFNFVTASEKSRAFDENNEVEYMWNCLLKDNDSLGLEEFIKLAAENNKLNKLFPFTSLYTLCFSKCTGYPFDTTDLPNVTPIEYIHFSLQKNTAEYAKIRNNSTLSKSKIYVVTNNKTQYVGEGNATEALKLVCDNLPKDIGPAIKGIADS